jgi:hypothetical protein
MSNSDSNKGSGTIFSGIEEILSILFYAIFILCFDTKVVNLGEPLTILLI